LTSGANGTVIYNQADGGQNVIVANYGNLTFNNSNKVLPSSGTIIISNVFTPGTATGHVIQDSTIEFNSGGTQTIPAFNYYNLSSSGGGNRNLGASGIIGIAGVFSPGVNGYSIAGSTIDF